MATESIVLPTLGFDYLRAAKRSRGILADMSDAAIEDVALRYRRFLLLKAKNPTLPIAPTEIIDEMWHLHMLHPVAYANDCMALFGAILDHAPGFGSTDATRPALLRCFSRTAALWEAEFGEPYCVPGARFHNVIVCADEEEEDGGEPGKPGKPAPKPPAPKPPSAPAIFPSLSA
ncbi:glycine-rich domain-containing protein [Sorangium sp. So ce1389]|uniref:glycine-rich domain-containing protein n=1 Tax=Sorangium sp. So ce1389 TaxID=3133336 RepID=UPI003F6379DD